MATSVKSLLEAANSAVPRISPEDAKGMLDRGEAVMVDVRDASEVEKTGRAEGALHIARGVLEFKADPASPSHAPELDQDRAVILYCGGGSRAALAGKTLQDFGYKRVYNLGGFLDWANAGLPIED